MDMRIYVDGDTFNSTLSSFYTQFPHTSYSTDLVYRYRPVTMYRRKTHSVITEQKKNTRRYVINVVLMNAV